MDADTQQDTLLRACSLLFVFRALAMARSEDSRVLFESQILQLIADMVPCEGGSIRFPGETDERSAPSGQTVLEVPLMVRGATAGVLATWFAPREAANLQDHRDTLSAIATLASAALESARDVERLETQNQLLRERLGAGGAGIVGESIAIHKLLHLIARVAPQTTSVLILGESGTGKELV